MERKTIMWITVCLAISAGYTYGQEEQARNRLLSLSSNLLSLGSTTLNIGGEIPVAPEVTFYLSGSYNPWNLGKKKKIRQLIASPEIRRWFRVRDKEYYAGVHSFYGIYNAGGFSGDYRYEGSLFGAGISYGHRWRIGQRWSAEVSVGAGYARLQYKKYHNCRCGPLEGSYGKNYWGLTKAGVFVIYHL